MVDHREFRSATTARTGMWNVARDVMRATADLRDAATRRDRKAASKTYRTQVARLARSVAQAQRCPGAAVTMVDLFNCHTGRTAARMPRKLAHVASIILTRVTGRTWDYEVTGRGWLR